MAEPLKELAEEVKKQGQTITKIHLLLAGNDDYGQRGLKHEIADHEMRLDGHDKRLGAIEEKSKKGIIQSAKMFGLGGLAGGLGAYLTNKFGLGWLISLISKL